MSENETDAVEAVATALVENYGGLLKDGWSAREPSAEPGTPAQAANVAADLAEYVLVVLRSASGSPTGAVAIMEDGTIASGQQQDFLAALLQISAWDTHTVDPDHAAGVCPTCHVNEVLDLYRLRGPAASPSPQEQP